MKEIFYSRRSINNTTYTIIQTLWKPRGTMIKCYSPCRSETITQFAEAGKQFAAASDCGSTPLTHSCGHNFVFIHFFVLFPRYFIKRTTDNQLPRHVCQVISRARDQGLICCSSDKCFDASYQYHLFADPRFPTTILRTYYYNNSFSNPEKQ